MTGVPDDFSDLREADRDERDRVYDEDWTSTGYLRFLLLLIVLVGVSFRYELELGEFFMATLVVVVLALPDRIRKSPDALEEERTDG